MDFKHFFVVIDGLFSQTRSQIRIVRPNRTQKLRGPSSTSRLVPRMARTHSRGKHGSETEFLCFSNLIFSVSEIFDWQIYICKFLYRLSKWRNSYIIQNSTSFITQNLKVYIISVYIVAIFRIVMFPLLTHLRRFINTTATWGAYQVSQSMLLPIYEEFFRISYVQKVQWYIVCTGYKARQETIVIRRRRSQWASLHQRLEVHNLSRIGRKQ